MGFIEKAKQQAAEAQEQRQAQQQAQQRTQQQAQAAAHQYRAGCPGDHYLTEVNRGSIRMQTWQAHLNDMYQRGYRLAHVLEQDGNTVQVYEHYFH